MTVIGADSTGAAGECPSMSGISGAKLSCCPVYNFNIFSCTKMVKIAAIGSVFATTKNNPQNAFAAVARSALDPATGASPHS